MKGKTYYSAKTLNFSGAKVSFQFKNGSGQVRNLKQTFLFYVKIGWNFLPIRAPKVMPTNICILCILWFGTTRAKVQYFVAHLAKLN